MKRCLNWLFDYPNLKIYQYDNGFKFSMDSLLLAEFVDIRKNDEKIIDFCTGNSVIPIVLNWKYHKKIVGIEIQKEIYDLGCLSVKYNQMDNDIVLIHDNVKNINKYYSVGSFDVVICNPPYFAVHNMDFVNQSNLKKYARHELFIDLDGILKLASEMLRNRGRLYLVHISSRLNEILVIAHRYHLFAKKIQFIYPKKEKMAGIVLILFIKNGNFGTTVLAPKFLEDYSTYQNMFGR